MTRFPRLAEGHFHPRTLRYYLGVKASLFWGLLFLGWCLFPEENAFSIHTHTISYLGSFEEDRNPQGWWLFCIAMTTFGLAALPIVQYIHVRVAPVAPESALWARSFLVTGCAGIVMVGLAPDAQDPAIGFLRWTDLHYMGAATLLLGFLVGIPWTALLVRRSARDPRYSPETRRAFDRARWPHALFLAVTAIALFFLIRWNFVYGDLRARADAAGIEIGSAWREAMNTPYSFPLWDNVFVHTLFLYFLWTALALPAAIPDTDERRRR